jgi:histidinol-phosphate aminotransferase
LDDYEAGRSVQQVSREFGIPLERIVKLASNENPYGPSPEAVAAIPGEFANLYMYPWQEFTDLRCRVAEANHVHPANIVLGSGSEAIVQMIPRLYLEPADEAIVSPQSYSRYAVGSAVMGAVVRPVPLREYRFDLNAVARAVNERTRIIWLCSPNNPTGTIIRRDEMRSFLAAVPEAVAVVLDQAYGEFVDDPEYGEGVRLVRKGHPNVIVLKTFSKAYGLAGLRLGYALLDGDLANLAEQSHEPFHVSREAAAAGLAALADDQWLARHVAGVRQRRTWLAIQIEQLGLSAPPSQANFLLVNTRRPAGIVAERMLRYGVSVRAAASWGYPTHVRISVGKPSQCRQAIRVLRKVCAEVDATGDSVGMERGGQ